jgi:DNA primase
MKQENKTSILDVIDDINKKMYIPDILAQERGDKIPAYDFNTSCVAHTDNSPSMRVYIEPHRGCYCFSCGKSFTPYKVMQHLTGLSARDIIQRFVDNYGYVIPSEFSADNSFKIDNHRVATRIKQIRKYLNPKTITILNQSLTADFKNGNTKYLDRLYDMIIAKFEADHI